MTTRILLIASPKTVMGFDRVTRLPNLGLNSITANISDPDVDVKIVDLVVARQNIHKYLLNTLRSFRPQIVGFSCMSFQFQDALRLASLVKSVDRDILAVFGGYHPTLEFEAILNQYHSDIDVIIRNEGERAFDQLITQWKAKKSYHDVPSLSFSEGGQVVHNAPSDVLDLDDLAIPDRKARLIRKGFHILGVPADVVETSRGCVNRCKFCCIRQMYGQSYRTYSIERVIRDIRSVRQQGVRAILFSDDNVTVHPHRFGDLCDAIIDNKLHDIKYAVQASIPSLRQKSDLPRLMARAGVDIVFLGIENMVSDNVQFLDTKRVLPNETKETVRELQGYGMTVIGSFIIGNQDDTKESIVENFNFANEIEVDIPLFLILTPFPKTEMRDDLLRADLITNKTDYSRYDLFHANVKTKFLSSEDLETIRDEIAFKIFKEKRRLIKLIKKYPTFFTRTVVNHLIMQPKEIVGYVRGLSG